MNFKIALLLWLLEYCSAQDADCDFNINVTVGETYNLNSPNYPKNYTPGVNCRWIGVCPSGYQCRLVCTEFSLPKSLLCKMDHLLVSRTGDRQLIGATPYCGAETLPNITSIGQSIGIGLKTSQSSTGGKFSCQLTAQPTPPTLLSSAVCSCGMRRQNRIVGGKETGINEYPMMAGLVDLANRLIYCGATIISERYILTATTCVLNRQLYDIAVVVGEHDVSTGKETSAAKLLKVSGVLKHTLFNESNNDYDIAIVSVATHITFSDRVMPVCLPFKYLTSDFAGRIVTALGWGLLEFSGSKPNVLMEVNLNVLSQSSCKTQVPSVTDRQICVFTPGKGACQQDTGGPLLYTDPLTGQLFVVGVIGPSNVCGFNKPDIGTRVTAILDWIVENSQEAFCIR